MAHRKFLFQHMEDWSIENIEKYIWAKRQDKFSAEYYLTEEEIKTIILRLKADGSMLLEKIKPFIPKSKEEEYKDRITKHSLAKFAFTVTPQYGFPIFGTSQQLITRFDLQDYQ